MVCHSPRCYHCLFSLQSLFLEDLDSTEPKRDETNWEFCTFLNLSLSLSFSFSLSLSLSFFNKEASWKMYFFIYEQSWWDWTSHKSYIDRVSYLLVQFSSIIYLISHFRIHIPIHYNSERLHNKIVDMQLHVIVDVDDK